MGWRWEVETNPGQPETTPNTGPGETDSQRLGPADARRGAPALVCSLRGWAASLPAAGGPAARLPARCYSNGRVQPQPGTLSHSHGARPLRRRQLPLTPAAERAGPRPVCTPGAGGRRARNAAPGATSRRAEQPREGGRGPREDKAPSTHRPSEPTCPAAPPGDPESCPS